MNEEILSQIQPLRGLVATIVLTGSVMEEFAMCRENLRAWNIEHGLKNIEYLNIPAQLVEHGRDQACAHALNPNPEKREAPYDYVLQIDADAVFQPDALARILTTAFVTHPSADVVGGYAQLKSPPFLPTIDTGTGTWEPIFPGEGVLPVIRTGGHFLLIKTRILQKFGPPWFRTRKSLRPIDALREVDNFSRIHHHGENILAGEAWEKLLAEARSQGGGGESAVGEDSGFSDAVTAVGGKIFVDTNLVVGHIRKDMVTPEMLAEELAKRERRIRAATGVTR